MSLIDKVLKLLSSRVRTPKRCLKIKLTGSGVRTSCKIASTDSQENLTSPEQKRDNLEKNFEAARTPVALDRSEYEQRLVTNRLELIRLSEIYSDKHPSIIRLRDSIESLEEIVAAQKTDSDPNDQGEYVPQEQAKLDVMLAESDSKIDALRAQIDTTTTELEELEKNISRSAVNANRLDELERDYNILRQDTVRRCPT